MKEKQSLLAGSVGFSILLLVGLIVNGILGVSGFRDVYTGSLINQYTIQGNHLKSRIESSLKLGKKLYLLDSHVNALFYEALNRSEGIQHIYVADADNRILYSTRNVLKERNVPFAGTLDIDNGSPDSVYTVNFMDSTYICIPLYSGEDAREGMLIIEFLQETVSSYIYRISRILIGYGLLIFIAALIVYVIGLSLGDRNRRVEIVLSMILLFVSQIVFTIENYNLYNKEISEVFNKHMSVLAKSIATDIQRPLDYVESFDNMTHAEDYLRKQLERNPQCAGIYFTDNNLKVASYVYAFDSHTPPMYVARQNTDFYTMPIISGEATNYLALQINRYMITSILNDMALDSITIIIVALIFSFVLKDYFSLIGFNKKRRKQLPITQHEVDKNGLRLIRVSTFLIMFAAFETLSFIPLLIKEIAKVGSDFFSNMPIDRVISFPVSSYMLGITISMFITLFVIKRLHIRTRYIVMTLIFIGGSIWTVFSSSVSTLIAARLIAGFGFGGILLSTSSLVITYTSEATRSSGFGTNAASFAAATIAAIPIGGVVVSQFGYKAGIGVSVVFAFIFLIFSVFYIKPQTASNTTKPVEQSAAPITLRSFFKVLFSRHVISYILCINIPFQLIYVGLFQFLFPLYMNDTLHLSQGNIGRILSVFSIISLGAATVSRLSDRIKNDKLLLSIGASCVGVMLIAFNYGPAGSILLFVAVLAAMGVDNVFIDSIEEIYVASGDLSDVSEENILQSYKSIEKILSIFIPSLTSSIIIALGFSMSMQTIGIYSLAGALIFLVLGKNGRWKKVPHDTEVEHE